jgi:hypothetical protein
VAGKTITAKPVAAGENVSFEVKVAGSYFLWADGRIVRGSLDGTPAGAEPRELAAGPHQLTVDAPYKRVTILWSRAAGADVQPLDKPSWLYYR